MSVTTAPARTRDAVPVGRAQGPAHLARRQRRHRRHWLSRALGATMLLVALVATVVLLNGVRHDSRPAGPRPSSAGVGMGR